MNNIIEKRENRVNFSSVKFSDIAKNNFNLNARAYIPKYFDAIPNKRYWEEKLIAIENKEQSNTFAVLIPREYIQDKDEAILRLFNINLKNEGISFEKFLNEIEKDLDVLLRQNNINTSLTLKVIEKNSEVIIIAE